MFRSVIFRALVDPTKTVLYKPQPCCPCCSWRRVQDWHPGTLGPVKMTGWSENPWVRLCIWHRLRSRPYYNGGRYWTSWKTQQVSEGWQNRKIPILTSCCPGWVNFFEEYSPDLKDVPNQQQNRRNKMFGAIAKTYFADKIGVNRKDMVVVSIMPCLAKKYECQRDEFLSGW